MSVDANKILQRVKLKGEPKKIRMSMYVDRLVQAEFLKACRPESPSHVLEELMREFIESTHKAGTK